MAKEEKRSRMPQIGEAIFCIAYLLFDLIAAVIFFVNADGHTALYLFGILTLVLGGGDAFHLVPRIVKAFRGGSHAIECRMGDMPQSSFLDYRLMCCRSVFPFGKQRELWIMEDVDCHHHQLFLLFACCTFRKAEARSRYADDAQNDSLCLDDSNGAWFDWQL